MKTQFQDLPFKFNLHRSLRFEAAKAEEGDEVEVDYLDDEAQVIAIVTGAGGNNAAGDATANGAFDGDGEGGDEEDEFDEDDEDEDDEDEEE